jgi:hypothetical protein
MQPLPTSVIIHAEAHRQELLADAARTGPKIRRKRAGRASEPAATVAAGLLLRRSFVARCIAAGSDAFGRVRWYRKESSSEVQPDQAA